MTPSPRRCPRARHGGPCSAIGANGFIQVEAAVVNRMSAMRRPGESYSEVISRLVTNWPLILVSELILLIG